MHPMWPYRMIGEHLEMTKSNQGNGLTLILLEPESDQPLPLVKSQASLHVRAV